MIRRQDMKGFLERKSLWLLRPLGLGDLLTGVPAIRAVRAAVRGPRWVSTLRKIDADADAAREVPTPLLFVAAPAWTGGKDAHTYVGAH